MKQFLLTFSMTKPKWIFIITLLLTAITGAMIPNIVVDTDPENMLAEDQSSRLYHNEVKDRFDLYDIIVVGAVNNSEQGIYNPRSLQAIKQLTDGIAEIEGVVAPDMMALSTVDNISQEGPGTIRFEWLMSEAPESQGEADWINQQVERLPLLQDTLASSDDKATAIYVPIIDKDESYRISQEIEALIGRLDSDDEYHITGLPVAEDTFGYQMFVQMGISAPLAALVIFILMWVFFRNLKFIAAPMIIAMATVIITMGLLIGMGFTVHIMSSMIPIFLMPIAVVDSIHIMSEFSDNYKPGRDRKEVIKEVIGHLFTPMLYTSVTSAVGFFSLLLTPIPPVQIFGAYVGFGILLAFLLTIIFIPAYLIALKPKALASLQTEAKQQGRLQKGLKKIGKGSLAASKLVTVLFMAVVALSIWGITQIQINDNPVRWFKADHKIRVADKVLNNHFAGTYDAYLVLEADESEAKETWMRAVNTIEDKSLKNEVITIMQNDNQLTTQLNQVMMLLEDKLFDATGEQAEVLEDLIMRADEARIKVAYFQRPEILHEIEQLQQALADSGYVGKSNSLADVVKTVTRELKTGQPKDFVIPNNQNGVAQALLQYQSSHRPQDLWHMVTKEYSSTAVWLQLTSGDNQDMTQVVEFVDQYFADNPLPEGVKAQWAGKSYLNMVWQDEMVAGMLDSLMSAFVVVLLMMIILFRSVLFGLLAMLPLSITILFIYGLIGWVGKDYDMPIAVLSSLTLGLSIDFAIHFLERAREIFKQTGDFKKTMVKMFEEPASAISRNAIVIAVGFTPLLFAPLVPYITVGFFLATIMAASAAVTLVLLPVALKGTRRWAFKPQDQAKI
ncbi:efflux RND transporter permease subunit [Kangiella koreensis]|uniref:RND superfamily exporter n=1 Tax=Kangiella koreensis (strain DSM 16069 / JCM 12317 / KCTC 12182 / SW-125) TaxID=523791 RepID=C7R611_KANKD|nr:MMPL family transporter [Kangiella koreensis]ACV25442.1 RND superfamily exporter [Kangiella koreensis DSM 16069]